MRICYIGDANSIHTQRWVEWFASDHEVSVISTTYNNEPTSYQVVNLPQECAPGTRLVRWLFRIRDFLQREAPQLVHCHYINEAGWFGAAARHHPLVITAWGSDVYRAPVESRMVGRLNRWAIRKADWVTCDSCDQARVIGSWGVPVDRMSVIGWGVDRHQFHPEVRGDEFRRRLEIPADAPVLLSPRQWLPNSNIPTVVAAHELLPETVYLVLKRMPAHERDGGLRVQQAVAASTAAHRIRVVGQVDSRELPELYAASDAVVSLCETDGTPVSLLEAMALGRPVVALRNMSVAEWIDEPGGRLVDSLDPRHVADALMPFLIEPTVRAKASAHNLEIVQSRADRAAELGKMATVYARLLVEHGYSD
jgi:glycosyltransferase involved in cell wall biosynthesis